MCVCDKCSCLFSFPILHDCLFDLLDSNLKPHKLVVSILFETSFGWKDTFLDCQKQWSHPARDINN